MDDSVEEGDEMVMKPGHYIMVALAIMVGLGAGYFWGNATAKMALQVEAIKGGHAAWHVKDEHGSVSFEWEPTHAPEKMPAPEKPEKEKSEKK